jgi:hypothetical protein
MGEKGKPNLNPEEEMSKRRKAGKLKLKTKSVVVPSPVRNGKSTKKQVITQKPIQKASGRL